MFVYASQLIFLLSFTSNILQIDDGISPKTYNIHNIILVQCQKQNSYSFFDNRIFYPLYFAMFKIQVTGNEIILHNAMKCKDHKIIWLNGTNNLHSKEKQFIVCSYFLKKGVSLSACICATFTYTAHITIEVKIVRKEI